MAGHSKWANIKHRKAAQDARRGKTWTRLIREVTIAARMGGANINDNPRLRLATDKAYAQNMPKDTIERAIKRGAGALDGEQMEEVTYEGYAPGGVAVMVATVTDNRHRTVADVRHAFSRAGGNLGTDGSVAYLFRKRGVIGFPAGTNEDRVMEVALEAGAEDVESEEDGTITVYSSPEEFHAVLKTFENAKLQQVHAELTMVPSTYSHCEGETAEKVMKLIDALEELDDVQSVYSNADFPADLLND